jgi:anti-sigma factor RsiW
MSYRFAQAELEAYLDEALPADDMARIEKALRGEPKLAAQLAALNARRDAGLHSLGAIWRRHRLSCPSREQLGSYLLGTLPRETADYVEFHVQMVGCRYCRANLADLQTQQAEADEAVQSRRRKYFQSSAGYLRRRRR